jgi:hypothetical protein
MKHFTISIIIILACISCYGQNLVGYNVREIQKFMRENRQDMNAVNVVNEKFSYLKYSDNEDTQTLLFYLDQDSVCNGIKTICDFSIKAAKEKEFNSIYKTYGENRWIDTHDGKDYLVMIKEEKWSFVITIEPYK